MCAKKRPEGTEPWMPAPQYSRLLPLLSLNLIVRDIARSTAFYREVLAADIRYEDIDFAAMRLGEVELMLHADHTYEGHPWHADLEAGEARGLGAELRLLGVDPDAVADRAASFGATIVSPPADHAHGWRETAVRDPDGYEWAVGRLLDPGDPPASGP